MLFGRFRLFFFKYCCFLPTLLNFSCPKLYEIKCVVTAQNFKLQVTGTHPLISVVRFSKKPLCRPPKFTCRMILSKEKAKGRSEITHPLSPIRPYRAINPRLEIHKPKNSFSYVHAFHSGCGHCRRRYRHPDSHGLRLWRTNRQTRAHF